MLGRASEHYEPARLRVVAVMDEAMSAGVSEAEIDAELAQMDRTV